MYRIADVSRIVGVSASTLRLWEQHGILAPARGDARYRLYSSDELERARHARRLREVRVLQGHFEVELDYERTIALGTGDSICFESSRPHRCRNPGPERRVLLWIGTPPSF